MKIKTNSFVSASLGALLITASTSSLAMVMPENITDAELALIPKYCLYTQAFKERFKPHGASEGNRWVAIMGNDFSHLHHYCAALINLGRAERVSLTASQKQKLYLQAIGDLQYVTKAVSEDFILLPEVYTRLGRAYLLNREPAKANHSFAKARALKTDYWPAYSHWAEYLLSAGQKAEALAIVTTGLQHSPDAKPLSLLFSKLGGKPIDIQRRLPKEADVPSEASNTLENDEDDK